jgi:hypothetical protein
MSQSQSQLTDFPSSFYDGDIDHIAYLTPSNPLATPSNTQGPQSFLPDFLQQDTTPVVPSSLTRVGPNRKKAYVLYSNMEHNEWVEWWLQTEFGKKSKINWDSDRQGVWAYFHQVAHGLDGAPKVMCKRCEKILEHPHTPITGNKGYHGTSTMAKHLKSAACLRSDKKGKADITSFIRKGVCSNKIHPLYVLTSHIDF